MDWETKNWVTVFVRPEVADGPVKIQHEIAPANFVSRDRREVLLRLIAFGASATSTPTLETDQLNLDVKRN